MHTIRRLILAGVASFCLGAPLLAQSGSVYKIRMTSPGATGMKTDCAAEGYILAQLNTQGGGTLQANGSLLDSDGSPGPELDVNLISDVPWTRFYDVGKGLSGVFNGCHGETYGPNGFGGNMWIYFGTNKGKSVIRILWHFEYYVTHPNVNREHFTLEIKNVPFPAWNSNGVSGRVKATGDFQYYRKAGKTILSMYESMTGGAGRFFEFDLEITPL